MSTEEKLPLDLTWQADGHATEVALAMIADGEHALLSEGALHHAAMCEACSQRLGEAALLSLRATEELPAAAARLALAEARTEIARPSKARSLQASPESFAVIANVGAPIRKPIARPMPVRAIFGGLLIAVLGAIPSLIVGLPKIPDVLTSFVKMLPILGRSTLALVGRAASSAGWAAPVLTWLAALLFLIAGITLARLMSRARSVQGGVG